MGSCFGKGGQNIVAIESEIERMTTRMPDPIESTTRRRVTSTTPSEKRVSGDSTGSRGEKLVDPYENITGEKMTLGMWCFWVGEGTLGQIKGVIRVCSGFINGGEVVQAEYDPKVTTFAEVLTAFTKNPSRSGKVEKADLAVIFYHNSEQKAVAEKLFQGKGVEILPAKSFSLASHAHQKYYIQRYKRVMKILGLEPGPELVKSHIATKLDGYLLGYGTIEGLEATFEQLNLPQNIRTFLRDLVIEIGISTEKGGLCKRR